MIDTLPQKKKENQNLNLSDRRHLKLPELGTSEARNPKMEAGLGKCRKRKKEKKSKLQA